VASSGRPVPFLQGTRFPFYSAYPGLPSGAIVCRPFGAGVGSFVPRLSLKPRRRKLYFSKKSTYRRSYWNKTQE